MADPADRVRRRILAGLAGTVACGAAARGMAASARRAPVLAALLDWLPGRYVGADAALTILPVYAPMTAPNAFYARETARDDERLVRAQQLLAVSEGRRGRALLRVWRFADAERWREAHRSPDLFKGLMPGDALPGPVAEVDWDASEPRLVARRGSGFAFELDANAITFRQRYEREGGGLP
jgi:hypothetical protein